MEILDDDDNTHTFPGVHMEPTYIVFGGHLVAGDIYHYDHQFKYRLSRISTPDMETIKLENDLIPGGFVTDMIIRLNHIHVSRDFIIAHIRRLADIYRYMLRGRQSLGHPPNRC